MYLLFLERNKLENTAENKDTFDRLFKNGFIKNGKGDVYASWVDDKFRSGFICKKCGSDKMYHHGDNCFYCPDCGFAPNCNISNKTETDVKFALYVTTHRVRINGDFDIIMRNDKRELEELKIKLNF